MYNLTKKKKQSCVSKGIRLRSPICWRSVASSPGKWVSRWRTDQELHQGRKNRSSGDHHQPVTEGGESVGVGGGGGGFALL